MDLFHGPPQRKQPNVGFSQQARALKYETYLRSWFSLLGFRIPRQPPTAKSSTAVLSERPGGVHGRAYGDWLNTTSYSSISWFFFLGSSIRCLQVLFYSGGDYSDCDSFEGVAEDWSAARRADHWAIRWTSWFLHECRALLLIFFRFPPLSPAAFTCNMATLSSQRDTLCRFAI